MEIEKGVPIPENSGNKKYPWKELEVGDSFFTSESAQTVAGSASHASKRTNRKFICRSVDGGTRVWRVK